MKFLTLRKKIEMDLQTRKISFVQEFLNIQSEEVVIRLEKLLRKEKAKSTKNDFSPMSLDEFNKRIDQAEEDIKKGKVTDARDLLKIVEKWE